MSNTINVSNSNSTDFTRVATDVKGSIAQGVQVGEYYSNAKTALLPSIAFRVFIIFIASILARSILILYGRSQDDEGIKNFDTESYSKDFYLKYVGLILLFELLLNYLIMVSLAGFKCVSKINERRNFTEIKDAMKDKTSKENDGNQDNNKTGGSKLKGGNKNYLPDDKADTLHWTMFLPFPVFNDFLPNAGEKLKGLEDYEMLQWLGPAFMFFIIGVCINDILGKTVFQKIKDDKGNLDDTSLSYREIFDIVLNGKGKGKDAILKDGNDNMKAIEDLLSKVKGNTGKDTQQLYRVEDGSKVKEQIVINNGILDNKALTIKTNNEWVLDTFWIVAPTIYSFVLLMFDLPIAMSAGGPSFKKN